MGKLVRRLLRGLGVMATLVFALTFMLTGTAAADCGTIPASERVKHHKEISHIEMKTVPGTAEEGYDAQRWSRPVEAVTELSHLEAQFNRLELGQKEESHKEWRFFKINPGQEEISWQVYRFFRENPGHAEVTHQEYQFKRTNPGSEKQTHTEYKFKRWVDGTSKKCDTEYLYSRTVKTYDTVYEWEKHVKGVKYKKDSQGEWRETGQFGWRDYPNAGPTWDQKNGESGPHNSSWTEGDTKYRSTEYKYVKTGNDKQVETSSKPESSGWVSKRPSGDGWELVKDREVNCTPATDGYYEYKTTNGTTRDRGAADWFKDSSFDGWKVFDTQEKTDQDAIEPFTEYKTADGATRDRDAAGWFKKDSYDGWTQFNSKTELDEPAVAPFTEYKTENGTTTNPDKASWFKDSSFEGWTQFGDADTHIEQPAIEPFTEYRDADGEPTPDEDKAAWFRQSSFSGWNQYGQPKTEIDQVGTPDVTYYLTITNEGKFGETTVKSDASWINIDRYTVDTSVWTQIGTAVKKIDREAADAYTEYYVPGGTPTRKLGESNWTTDEPKGWTFVDKKFIVTKKAVPAKVVPVKVVDKKASVEKIEIPAKKLSCNPVKRTGQQAVHNTRASLAETGASGGIVAVLLLGIGALAAGGVAVKRGLRNRK